MKAFLPTPIAALVALLSVMFVLSPMASHAQKAKEAELDRLAKQVKTLRQHGEYSEAAAAAEKYLKLTIQLRGNDHLDTAFSLYNLANLYRVQGHYDEAEPLYLRCLEIFEKQRGADHPDTVDSLNNLAILYRDQGRYDEAEPLYRRCLEIDEKQRGSNHPDTAVSLNRLAALYHVQGRHDEAEPLYRRVLEIREKQLGADHPDTAVSLNNLALLCRDQGRYEEAEPLYLRCLEIDEKQRGSNHPDTADSMENLAVLYHAQGRHEEAEPLCRRVLEIREKRLGTDHPDTADSLNNLAILYGEQGRHDEAEPLCLRALEIWEKQLGVDHPDTAHSLNNLAGLYYEQGRHDEAEPLYLHALEIREKQLGADHPDTAGSLNNLALLYRAQDRFAEAEPLFKRSLEIKEKQLGADHPGTAASLNSLAGLYFDQDRYDEAEPLYRRSLEIREKRLGADHPDTAVSLNGLAGLHYAKGRYDEAEPLCLRALEIFEKQRGANHPDTAVFLNNVAKLYRNQGRHGEADPLVERGIQSATAYWRSTLAYFSERECLAFQSVQFPLEPPGNQGSGRLAAEAQLLFKGAVIDAMNARKVGEAQLVGSKQGRDLLQKREMLRPRYQHAVLKQGSDSDGAKTLQQQLEDLDKRASTLMGSSATAEALLSVGLEPVRQALPENARLVETFRYTHWIDPKTKEPRYATTLIAPTGEPAFLSHGEAESIEAAIQAYRSLLDGSQTDATPEALREAETTLYTRLLAPLEEQLSPGQTVIFSPDAQLHFIPLGLLRDAEGKAFAEKYQVRYVSSGRDLVKEVPSRKTTGLKAFALGNPAYRDNAPMLALAGAEEDTNKNALASNLRAGMGQDSGSIQFRPLPGTAREVDNLSARLKDKGCSVFTLSGKDATEAAVKQGMAGHDIIHLATHGFFLNELKTTAADNPLSRLGQDDQRPKGPVQNPMFRSGLALAGAQSTFNLWKGGQIPPPAADGVLLAAELTGIDLRGTDLVVLSACETASGESLDGEGVMGLRRTLNAAGATNVVMTLWPVDDAATVEVMEVFYQKYLSGVPAAKAMAETQRELLPQWIKEHGEVKALSRLAPFLCTSLGAVE